MTDFKIYEANSIGKQGIALTLKPLYLQWEKWIAISMIGLLSVTFGIYFYFFSSHNAEIQNLIQLAIIIGIGYILWRKYTIYLSIDEQGIRLKKRNLLGVSENFYPKEQCDKLSSHYTWGRNAQAMLYLHLKNGQKILLLTISAYQINRQEAQAMADFLNRLI